MRHRPRRAGVVIATDPARHLRELGAYNLADQYAAVGDESPPADKALWRAVHELVKIGDSSPQMWRTVNDALRTINDSYTRAAASDRQLFG